AVTASQAPAAAGNAGPVLNFEANEGQVDPRVNFLVRGPGSSLFLTPTEAVHSIHQPDGSGGVLRMQVVGAPSDAPALGLNELAGRSNYFRGNDPQNWHTNIPHFGAVAYQGVYPGVDLVYHGTSQGQLEYDFVVAPGIDPGIIQLQFRGAQSLQLDGQGNL